MDTKLERQLAILSTKLRMDALEAVFAADSGHIGGSFSIMEILTYLYFNKMRIQPENPHWEERDRLVLSKGHCTPALYSVLAERGFFDKKELRNFRDIDSMLSGHAEIHVPGVDVSTGSLGHGVSVAVGMALNAKIDKSDYRVYAIAGDGEIQEGQIWEAAMSAAHFNLDNLTLIVDNNDLQIDGSIKEVMSPYPIDEKFRAFGWHVINIDGHNFSEIDSAIREAENHHESPTAIIARTIKGKGVSFMENVVDWHGETPDETQYKAAMDELRETLRKLEEGNHVK